MTELQLRVLSGLHEGAVVALTQEVALGGRGTQADVVLRDAPGQAWLVRQAQQAQQAQTPQALASLTDEGHGGDRDRSGSQEALWCWRERDFEQALQVGQAWRWGSLVLQLASADQAWEQAQAVSVVFEREGSHMEPSAQEGQGQKANEAHGPALEQGQTQGKTQGKTQGQTQTEEAGEGLAQPQGKGLLQHVSAKSGRSPLARVLLVLVMGIVLILGVLVLLVGRAVPKAAVEVPSVQKPVVHPQEIRQVEKVVGQLGLAEALEVRVSQDGRLWVLGVVLDVEQLETLSNAIGKVTGRYEMSVLTQGEFEARVRVLQANMPEGVEVLAEPGGLLAVLSSKAQTDWKAVGKVVGSELPEVVQVEYRTLETEQKVVEWEEKRQAKRELVQAKAPQVKFAKVPQIVSVVGGDRPYLLLEDGQRWLLGGRMGEVVLQGIDDEAVVFVDKQGATLRKVR